MAPSTSQTRTTTAWSWFIPSSRVTATLLLATTFMSGCDDTDARAEESFVPADYADAFEEVRDCRFSVEHDAVYVRILAAPAIAEAYRDGRYPFEEGAVIVKEEHRTADCNELIGVTAMQRLRQDDDPELGDWQWQRYDAALRPTDIEPQRCVACHQACTRGRDLACADP